VKGLPPAKLRTLGRTVARLRTQAGLSQERLAEVAEVHVRFLQKVEAGQFGASLLVLGKIKKAVKASWDELLRGVE